jgi:hypothetical protein
MDDDVSLTSESSQEKYSKRTPALENLAPLDTPDGTPHPIIWKVRLELFSLWKIIGVEHLVEHYEESFP